MTARMTDDNIVVLERRPGCFAFFVSWAASRPEPRRAIWTTTALFGGVGCSVLHPQNVAEAASTYLSGYMLALVVMVPWFFADYRINKRWQR